MSPGQLGARSAVCAWAPVVLFLAMVPSAFAEQALDTVIDFSEYPFPGGGTQLIQNDNADQTVRYNLFDDASGAKLSADNSDLDDLTIRFRTSPGGELGATNRPRLVFRDDGDSRRIMAELSFDELPDTNNPGTRQFIDVEVCLAPHLNVRELALDTSSFNTRGTAWEFSQINFLDARCDPFPDAPTVPPYLEAGDGASGPVGLGHYLWADTGTVLNVGGNRTEVGSSGPGDSPFLLSSSDARLDRQRIGGFRWRTTLEDVRGTENISSPTFSASLRNLSLRGAITEAAPSLALSKRLTAAPEVISAGSGLTYTVTASNTGNVTLSNVVINDDLIAPQEASCVTLAVGDSCVLSGSYTVTQADIDTGQIVNTALAEASETDQQQISVTTPIARSPALSLDKALIDAPSPIGVGSVLSYRVTAINSGNVTLTNLLVGDSMLRPSQQTCASVALGASCTLNGTYTVTQADVDAGLISNTGFADATETDLREVTITTPLSRRPALAVTKALTDAPDPIAVGSELAYTVTASNEGNVTLNSVVVSDPLINPPQLSCASVAPGATCVLTGSYTVSQADIDTGQVDNTATATADATETAAAETTITTPLARDPVLTVIKKLTGSPERIVVGSELAYTVTASNEGNVTLTSVVVTDPLLSPQEKTCASLALGNTCVLAGRYTVTQEDVDAGQLDNTGFADATETERQEATSSTPLAQDPLLRIFKKLTAFPEIISAGSTLEYTVTASNEGNVTLTDVVVRDWMISPEEKRCAKVTVGTSCVLIGSYTVTDADIAAGEVVNLAIADATETSQEEITVTTLIVREQPSGPAAAARAVPATNRGTLALLALLSAWVAYRVLHSGRSGSPARDDELTE